ncbi:MAG: dephospho-CoA kinase [Bacteroides sp.]|nr:dephospho-CoA kinase [Roseburia sp.]MCM1346992.1 dephospho-CoA kinase [Bacteroides sp.]MCM1421544.1 dephospho-CoA kinase [Bacteroides sp.]
MKIGITGGIGSGKSYICDKLRRLGFPVYSCDYEAKQLMVCDACIIDGVKRLVGDKAYTQSGEIDRAVIANFVFSGADNVRQMNAIVHPRVKAHFEAWARQCNAEFVFMESAILFESGFDDVVDKTVAVYAPKNVRLLRAMRRDHATEAQIVSRMNSQMDEDEKRGLADFVIVNDSVADVDGQIQNMLDALSLN